MQSQMVAMHLERVSQGSREKKWVLYLLSILKNIIW